MERWVAAFFVSLLLALVLTPVARQLASHYRLVDNPSYRKIHMRPVPRVGGAAIYLSFMISFLLFSLLPTARADLASSSASPFWIGLGASVVFGMGLVDDIHHLRPTVKLGFQLLAACLAFSGGVRILFLEVPGSASVWTLGWFSLPMTILWFLVVINGINLIDGLDGLAAGVTFIASTFLLVLAIRAEHVTVALGLAALSGVSLGFLHYNFGPASIFMGDSGSYFLGYMLAVLSLLIFSKSQGPVNVIPLLIVLGVPLLDTFLAPIRRFILGKHPFAPDTQHIHHRLMSLGLNERGAVLLVYATTIALGILSLLVSEIHNEWTIISIIFLGCCALLAICNLGYLRYLRVERVKRYLRDVADETGLNRHRRRFLEKQIAIADAPDADHMWEKIIETVAMLRMDRAEIHFNGVAFRIPQDRRYHRLIREPSQIPLKNRAEHSGIKEDDQEQKIFSISLPLADNGRLFGTLQLMKDTSADGIDRHTLKRIEHLRRSIVEKLKILENDATRMDGIIER